MYEIFGIVKVKVYICDMIFMISRFTKSSLEVRANASNHLPFNI